VTLGKKLSRGRYTDVVTVRGMEMGACSLFETTDCATNAERFNL